MSEYDLPPARRYLDIMMAGLHSGADPESQGRRTIPEFNDPYPPRTEAREAILLAARILRRFPYAITSFLAAGGRDRPAAKK
jgi:hypothetical protein